MPSKTAVELLDELSEIKAAVEVTRIDYEEKRKQILEVVKDDLSALELEYAPMLTTVNQRVADLENEAKQAVLAEGKSVKGASLHAVWVSGRVSWDAKPLERYAVDHPEILLLRKQGEPSVTIRALK